MNNTRQWVVAFATAAGLLLTGCAGDTTEPGDPIRPESSAPTIEAERHSLGQMEVGEVAFQNSLAMEIDPDGRGWLRLDETAIAETGGTAFTRVERHEDGYHVWLFPQSKYEAVEKAETDKFSDEARYAPVVAIHQFDGKGSAGAVSDTLPESYYSYTVADLQPGESAYSSTWPLWVDEHGTHRMLSDSEISPTEGKPSEYFVVRLERHKNGLHVWLSGVNTEGVADRRADPPHDGAVEADYEPIAVIH